VLGVAFRVKCGYRTQISGNLARYLRLAIWISLGNTESMPFRLDRFHIDKREFVGSRLRVDGYLSRTGVQSYDQGDGTTRREQRDAGEVFSKESLASFRGMPVTIQHPPQQMLDADNWRALAHGHVGDDVREAEDGQHTKASIWILDSAAQRRVSDKELVELSVGYFADLDETPGTNDKGEQYDARQIGIRGNHLALLKADQARGGRGCRLDSQGNARYDEPADPAREKAKMNFKIKADGYDHEVEADTDSLTVALDKERTKRTKIHDELQAHLDEIKAKLDAEIEKVQDLDGKLKVALDPKTMADSVDAMIKIRTDSRKVAGKEIELKGTRTEIMTAALTARGIDVADKSDAYIEARFDAALEAAPTADHLADARRTVVGSPDEIIEDDNIIDLAGCLRDKLAGKDVS